MYIVTLKFENGTTVRIMRESLMGPDAVRAQVAVEMPTAAVIVERAS